MVDFFNLNKVQWEGICRDEFGVPPLHAANLLRSAYKDFNTDPWLHPRLPKALTGMKGHYDLSGVVPAKVAVSAYDGTVKFLGQLVDGSEIETVLMPEKSRITVCVSSQVGCAQACSFCYTGRMGLKRNLSAGEIVGQVMMVNRWLRTNPDWCHQWGYDPAVLVENLVFMGMGEPLDNVEQVNHAIGILTEPLGLAMGLRKISVSTAGHLDGLKSLLELRPNVKIALSLHATTDRERSQLMPINRRWPIATVLEFLDSYYAGKRLNKGVLVQYTVIHGVNDSLAHAKRLAELLKGRPVKLNLIPLNEVEPSRFQSPKAENLEAFKDYIHQAGIRVMVRYSKGQDIDAACGQLVVNQSR